MERHLKIIYAMGLMTIAFVWATLRATQQLNPGFSVPLQTGLFGGPVLFILTAACALAGPILYRTLFAHGKRKHARIVANALFIFERNLILIGLAALGLAMLADIMVVPFFYRSGSLLMALYAVYCVFPSEKRLMLDRRRFRVAIDPRKPPKLTVLRNSSERQTTLKKIG